MSVIFGYVKIQLLGFGQLIGRHPVVTVVFFSLLLLLASSAYLVLDHSARVDKEKWFSEMDLNGRFVAPTGVLDPDASFPPLIASYIPEPEQPKQGLAVAVAPENILDPDWLPRQLSDH